MFSTEDYQLLDFGNGRRLERFGRVVVDRPCPAVERIPCAVPDVWQQATLRFERSDDDSGEWRGVEALPEPWTIAHGQTTFVLKPTPAGQVGLFPEQADNWNWIAEQVANCIAENGVDENSRVPFSVLNLFGYTGGSTLAAAAAGAEVVHVDAAGNIVAWARQNAGLSGLAERPIRWITEDAVKFVKRELKRGNRYQAIILDPPSYGHGRRGEVWRLAKHLPRLLAMCAELTADDRCFLLLTCHTPGFGPERLQAMVREALGSEGEAEGHLTADALTLRTADGRQMPSGVGVRWTRG